MYLAGYITNLFYGIFFDIQNGSDKKRFCWLSNVYICRMILKLNLLHMKRLILILLASLLLPGFAAVAQQTTPVTDQYPNPMGHLRLSLRQVDFHNVINTESKTDTLKIYNEWNQLMTISIQNLPEYMKTKAIPEQLKPGQKGIILITYDAAKRNDIGFLYDRITLTTNDSTEAEKAVSISVNIIEDFSKMTPEQLAKAAKIKFDTTTYDFGTIKEGQKVETEFKFTNIGDSLLRIRKVKGSWGCTASNAEKSILKKGESSKINVSIATEGKSGKIMKTVTVISNDPVNPNIQLNITGTIEKKDAPVPQNPEQTNPGQQNKIP
jgi:hypothetical protein